jgi:hypothetical protein
MPAAKHMEFVDDLRAYLVDLGVVSVPRLSPSFLLELELLTLRTMLTEFTSVGRWKWRGDFGRLMSHSNTIFKRN